MTVSSSTTPTATGVPVAAAAVALGAEYTNPSVGIVYTNSVASVVSTDASGLNNYLPFITVADGDVVVTNVFGGTRTSMPVPASVTPFTTTATANSTAPKSSSSLSISTSMTAKLQKTSLSSKASILPTVMAGGSSANSTLQHGTSSDNRLPNGTVAGIVIAVACGLALLTFLATFLVMRRKRSPEGKKGYKEPTESADSGASSVSRRGQISEPKAPFIAEAARSSSMFETHLPQSADDKTIQDTAKITLDHIELHVENFYQGVARSSVRPAEADIGTFNSPYLSESLGTLLAQSRNAVPLIKHALTRFITDSISPTANPKSTFLPQDFVLLPYIVNAANGRASIKPDSTQYMSRWRVLTAYLRPKPSQDRAYIAERDQRIEEIVRSFCRAFAPWKNPKYSDEDRMRSLSATLKEAADLGLFMFAQASDLQFRWSKQSEGGSNRIATAPALIKVTSEKGIMLAEPQVMLKIAVQRT